MRAHSYLRESKWVLESGVDSLQTAVRKTEVVVNEIGTSYRTAVAL
jgi:hypothetical protein